jgi:hypothetical protein
MIVAWHEVPGTAPPQKSRPVRVRYDSCRCAAPIRRLEGGNFECGFAKQNKLATGDGVFNVGLWQARSITWSSSLNILGHKPLKKRI